MTQKLSLPLPHAVSYPAYSVSPIGDFGGGDCFITLSDTRLSISSHDGHLIATWRYCTIRSFNWSSTDFCFISGRRGPYGVQEYTFNVSPSVMMILYSVLSKITGVKIQRDCTTTNCTNQPGDSSESRDQNLASNCYKVANSTFYIVIQSDSTDSADIDHEQITFLTPCNVSEGMHRDDLIPLVPLRPHVEGGLPVLPLMATLPTKESKVADSRGSHHTHNCKDMQWPSTNSNSGITDEYPKLTACSDLTETQEAETLLHSHYQPCSTPCLPPTYQGSWSENCYCSCQGRGQECHLCSTCRPSIYVRCQRCQ